MDIITATATEMQNNFGKYARMVMEGKEIIVTKNGNEIGRFVPKDYKVRFVTDSLIGTIGGDIDPEKEKEAYFREKYEITDR